jgi:hypothetical protein
MLKAIHAQEDRQAAEEKIAAVVKKIQRHEARQYHKNHEGRGKRDAGLLGFSRSALALIAHQ